MSTEIIFSQGGPPARTHSRVRIMRHPDTFVRQRWNLCSGPLPQVGHLGCHACQMRHLRQRKSDLGYCSSDLGYYSSKSHVLCMYHNVASIKNASGQTGLSRAAVFDPTPFAFRVGGNDKSRQTQKECVPLLGMVPHRAV